MTVVGVGIDIEGERDIRGDMLRFFLSPSEQSAPPSEWLRLWTVKESLYKACPDNARLLLTDFEVDDTRAGEGTARLAGNDRLVFRYTSRKMDNSILTFALCEEVGK